MNKNNTIVRLKKVLLSDKIHMPNGLIQLIKKDITVLLKSYFEFDEKNMKIEIDSDTEGLYDITIAAKAERVKSPKFL